MAKGRKLTDTQVVELRERHLFLREVDAAEGHKSSDTEHDTRVAKEFGVSVSHVRDLVMGGSRTEAEGPIDVARRERFVLFLREREALGDTEARRRLNLRSRNIDPEPKAVRYAQRVTVLDHRGKDTDMAVTLEPGQSIRVELVTEGGRP